MSGGSLYFNNLTKNVNGASPIQFQIGPQASTDITYVFNNVAVNTATNSPFYSCSNGIGSIYGTCLEFNNTNEGSNDPNPSATCTENGDKGPGYPVLNYSYNHCVTSASPYYMQKVSSAVIDTAGNTTQTNSAANSDGYNIGNYFAPQSSSAATVGVGGPASTMQAYCAAIGTKFGSQYQTACQHDTSLGVSIDAATHQVTGTGRTANPRPTSGNWDAGAYQYGSGTSVSVQPPSALSAVVQ